MVSEFSRGLIRPSACSISRKTALVLQVAQSRLVIPHAVKIEMFDQ